MELLGVESNEVKSEAVRNSTTTTIKDYFFSLSWIDSLFLVLGSVGSKKKSTL